MSFLESVDTPATHLHLHNPKKLLVIGLVAICVLVVTGVVITSGLFAQEEVTVIAHDAGDETGVQEPTMTPEELNDAPTGNNSSEVVTPSTEKICVHVGGCVVSPGVYWLDVGSRVEDALQAAGGVTESAAPDAINRARSIQDGEQILVFSSEEVEAGITQEPESRASSSSTSEATDASNMRVNINSADQSTLETLPGIGPATAQKIVAFREQQGRFTTPEDLMQVSGIGQKKFEAIADLICVS